MARTGSSQYVTQEHTCQWHSGANGDPLAGLLCIHGYHPQSPVEDLKGVQQTATATIWTAGRTHA